MTNSRRKGAQGERELVNLLMDELGIKLQRNLSQTRDGGYDLIGIPQLAIEVKRAAKPLMAAWWRQTTDNASSAGKIPVLAYRLDFQAWRFRVAMADILDWYDGDVSDITHTADYDVAGFCTLARELWVSGGANERCP